MSEKASSTSLWLKFFRGAGIPGSIDTKYALIFDENRIRMDMLMDLNKEILRDMGINAMGDIIAILKHAKKVHDETKEQAVEPNKPTQSQASSTPSKVSASSTQGRSSGSSQSAGRPVVVEAVTEAKSPSAAPAARAKHTATPTAGTSRVPERIVQTKGQPQSQSQVEKTRQETPLRKMIVLNKRSSSEGPLKEEVPVQKKIRVLPEQEGKYTIKMPEGTTARTKKIIQSRLGPGPSVSTLHSTADKKTVFARLGDSSVSSSTEDSRGVSQSSGVSDSKTTGSQPAKQSVFDRLGGRGKHPESSASISSANSQPKALLQMKVSVPEQASSVRSRLDTKTHQEKTLKTIPSRISIPYLTNRAKVRSEISSAVTSATTTTTTRIISAKSSSVPSSTMQSVGALKIEMANDQKRSRENTQLENTTQPLTTKIASQVAIPQQHTAKSKDEESSKMPNHPYNSSEEKGNCVFDKRKAERGKKNLNASYGDEKNGDIGSSADTDTTSKKASLESSLPTEKHPKAFDSEDTRLTPLVRITWRAKDESTYRITRTGSRSSEAKNSFAENTSPRKRSVSKRSPDGRSNSYREDSPKRSKSRFIPEEAKRQREVPKSSGDRRCRGDHTSHFNPPRESTSRDRSRWVDSSSGKSTHDKLKRRSESSSREDRTLRGRARCSENILGRSEVSLELCNEKLAKKRSSDSNEDKNIHSDKYHSFEEHLLPSPDKDKDASTKVKDRSSRRKESQNRKSSSDRRSKRNKAKKTSRDGESSGKPRSEAGSSKKKKNHRRSSVNTNIFDDQHKKVSSELSNSLSRQEEQNLLKTRKHDRFTHHSFSEELHNTLERKSLGTGFKRQSSAVSQGGKFNSEDRLSHSSISSPEYQESTESVNRSSTRNEGSRKSSRCSSRSSRSRSKRNTYYDSDESALSEKGKHDRVNPKLDPERNYKSETVEVVISQILPADALKRSPPPEKPEIASKDISHTGSPTNGSVEKAIVLTTSPALNASRNHAVSATEKSPDRKESKVKRYDEELKKTRWDNRLVSTTECQKRGTEARSTEIVERNGTHLEAISDLELSDESQTSDSGAHSNLKTRAEPELHKAKVSSPKSLIEERYMKNTYVIINDQCNAPLMATRPANDGVCQNSSEITETNNWRNKEDNSAVKSSQDVTMSGSSVSNDMFFFRKSEDVRNLSVQNFGQSEISFSSNSWSDPLFPHTYGNDRSNFPLAIPRESGRANIVVRIRREINEMHGSFSTSKDSSSNFQSPSTSKVARYSERSDDRSLVFKNPTFSYGNAFVKETNKVECNSSGEEIIRITRPPKDKDEFVPDTKSVKIMERMGWSPGHGLGNPARTLTSRISEYSRSGNREPTVRMRGISDLDDSDYDADQGGRVGSSSRASSSSLEKRVQDIIRSPAPPPVDGQVLQTIRMPSKTKGKVIVKKLIYKKIPKTSVSTELAHLPEIEDPLANYYDDSDD